MAPLEEQDHIVEKVAELMRIIGDIKSLQHAKDLTLLDLRESALSELAEAEDNESTTETFNRIADNAEIIFSKPERSRILATDNIESSD